MAKKMFTENLSQKQLLSLFDGDGNWKTFRPEVNFPVITMSDGPHGLRFQGTENYSQINKSLQSTCFPTAQASCSTWNRHLIYEEGKALAEEAKILGVNLLLGPGTNIKRNPLCGRNFEYFSEDPYLSGVMASEYIKGVQSEGVGACLKHFACNNTEKNRQTENSIVSERALHEIYLAPFEYAVKTAFPKAIMTSYNRLNGTYTSENSYLLKEILREKWKFNGIVISDWGATINPENACKAGTNLSMPDSHGYFQKRLKSAINTDSELNAALNENAEKLLQTASELNQEKSTVQTDHHQLSVKIAEQSIILLKNDNALPLKSRKIVIIGELAEKMHLQGAGSSHVNCKKYPNAIQALQKLGYSVLFAKSKRKAVKFSKIAAEEKLPVLFFTGTLPEDEGEGFNRKNLQLPEMQTVLFKRILSQTYGKTDLIQINTSGSSVEFDFCHKINALVQLNLCGEGAGEALAKILSGKTSPSGKLTETFPIKMHDIPCTTEPENQLNIFYKEGIFTGYRYFLSKNIPARFPFGYGLSYTTFNYSNLQVKKLNQLECEISVTVKNTGKIGAYETVQFYVVNPQNNLPRSLIELKGFDKQFLEPNEEKCFSCILNERAFSVYSEELHDFCVIGGLYKVTASSYAGDFSLTEDIKIDDQEQKMIIKSSFKMISLPVPHKGSFTIADSLEAMSKESFAVKIFLTILLFVIRLMNFGKNAKDPVVKIASNAIKENPLVSLISTSGGAINETIASLLVKLANL